MALPPPPQERWSILARVPKLVKDKEAKRTFPPGADVSVACDEPPLASFLTVPLRICSPPGLFSYPYIAAADPSGLLLLCATEPDDEVTYHLCHAHTGEVTSLREHGRPTGFYGASVGLMVRGGSCVVAELLPATDGTGRATLLCYTVGQYKWVVKELPCSPPLPQRWSAESVVSYGGMLWWVELSYGLLACDPFADNPELLHVPLPQVLDQLPIKLNTVNWGAHSCVMVSSGKLRYVQIHGNPDAPLVSTWALTEDRKWNQERSVPLRDIWADESYLDAMLPWSIPALALLDPTDPDKLYFFLGSCIFALDLRRRKIVEFSEFGMPEPTNHRVMRSSHLVHAWQYDHSSSWSVLTCLRQEKEIAAGSRPGRKIRKLLKKRRDASIMQQQNYIKMVLACHGSPPKLKKRKREE
ncbi:unnamed protein product [Alopecurus aequalis]